MSDLPADHLLASVRVRCATSDDVPELLELKRSLAFTEASPARGGFLLGSSREMYLMLAMANQIMLVETRAEQPDVLGFGIALDHEVLTQSPLWARQQLIQWDDGSSPDEILTRRIGYLDQLAIRGDTQRQWLGALLAQTLMTRQAASHHDVILTTTLLAPVENTAALPLIARAGGRRVGTIAEHYDGVGDVLSAIHLIPIERFQAMCAHVRAHGDAFERHIVHHAHHTLAVKTA